MVKTTETELPSAPSGSRIQLSCPAPGINLVFIPKEGFSPGGIFIFAVILFWLLMILLWAALLLQYGIVWTLLSVPFWLLGLVTLRISARELFSSQSVEISPEKVIIRKKTGKQTASVVLKKKDISAVSFVEGSYKTLYGMSRKGIYTAIISKGEAFGIGERCRVAEKQWLADVLKSLIK